MIKTIEPANADSRPKGGNESRTHKNPTYIQAMKEMIEYQWNHAKPKWFITLQWSPLATEYHIASQHSRHFRNKLLTSIYQCSLKNLPQPRNRCRLVWFHEKAPDSKGRLIFHSHLHLAGPPAPYDSRIPLELLIDTQVAPGFKCLKNLHRSHDPGIVIKEWSHDHHALYNLKDHYRYKHHQDADIVLDLELSDLIMTK